MSFRAAPIKQIYFLQKEIEEKWKQMQDETEFRYDVPSSIFGLKKKENTNRLPKDLTFWETVDDYILDVNQPLFPDFITYNDIRYRFYGYPEAEVMRNEILIKKGQLKVEIDAYNERIEPGSRQIEDKSDIFTILKAKTDKERLTSDRISQKGGPSKENTVVILILCHGAYVVNENSTIDKIQFPENKLGEIVKKSVFGYSTLRDYNYTSRYPGNKTSTRYSKEVIKRKLKDAYESVLKNTTSITNQKQQGERIILQSSMLRDEKAYCKEYGLLKDSCMHVGFEFSHVPFLRKVYELDNPISANPITTERRGEFAHGIMFMFEDDEGKLIQRNLNRLEDFRWLQENGYINIPERVEDLVDYWGTPYRDIHKSQLYDGDVVFNEILITKLDTELLMSVIGSFPEKYNFFKIVDNSCGNFKNLSRELTAEEEKRVLRRYWDDMQCSNPEYSKGGRRRRKCKTSKGNSKEKRKTKNKKENIIKTKKKNVNSSNYFFTR
jgi:hypothetical protein